MQLRSLYSQGRPVVKNPEFQISWEYMLDSYGVDMSSRQRQGNCIHLNASSIIRYSYTLVSRGMHYHCIRSNPLPIVLTIPLPSKKDSRHNSQRLAAKCKYTYLNTNGFMICISIFGDFSKNQGWSEASNNRLVRIDVQFNKKHKLPPAFFYVSNT